MGKMLQTPSQTVGPYFAYGLTPEQYLYDFESIFKSDEAERATEMPSDAITIMGAVYDGQGVPIPDAMVEIWQCDGERQFFGRCGTGTHAGNRFIFHTFLPKSVDGQAPNMTVIVFMRGQLIHTFTKIFFPDEMEWNAQDALLQSVPEARRHTLIAQKNGAVYQFDIRMQGENETVFFEI